MVIAVWVVLASAAVALAGVLAAFAAALVVQRRRARVAAAAARAAEDAARRRRKRRRAGLRSAEIDAAAPEARVIVAAAGRAARSASLGDDDHEHDDGSEEGEDGESARSGRSEAGVLSDGARSEGVKASGASASGRGAAAAGSTEDPAEDAAPAVLAEVVLADGEDTCAVCLDDLRLAETVRRLPCAHVFHSPCIRQWLRRKNACPCCCAQVVKKRRRKRRPPADPVTLVLSGRVERSASGRLRVPGGGAGNSGIAPLPLPPPPPPPPTLAPPPPPTLAPPPAAASGAQCCPAQPQAQVQRMGARHPADVQAHAMSSSFYGDRPMPADRLQRPSMGGGAAYGAFPRSGSLLDPEDPAGDVLASETSTAFGDAEAGESLEAMLDHVRRVLRGEASQISIGAYSTDCDDVPDPESVPVTVPDAAPAAVPDAVPAAVPAAGHVVTTVDDVRIDIRPARLPGEPAA